MNETEEGGLAGALCSVGSGGRRIVIFDYGLLHSSQSAAKKREQRSLQESLFINHAPKSSSFMRKKNIFHHAGVKRLGNKINWFLVFL